MSCNVCRHACMHACMDVWRDGWMDWWIYVCMYVYVHMHVCVYVCIYVCVCVCVYIYTTTYIYMYIYVYIYIHILKSDTTAEGAARASGTDPLGSRAPLARHPAGEPRARGWRSEGFRALREFCCVGLKSLGCDGCNKVHSRTSCIFPIRRASFCRPQVFRKILISGSKGSGDYKGFGRRGCRCRRPIPPITFSTARL